MATKTRVVDLVSWFDSSQKNDINIVHLYLHVYCIALEEILKLGNDSLELDHIGTCRSIPAKPADDSCRRKEHSQTLKRIDEILIKPNILHLSCFLYFFILLIRIIYGST